MLEVYGLDGADMGYFGNNFSNWTEKGIGSEVAGKLDRRGFSFKKHTQTCLRLPFLKKTSFPPQTP